jgi:uncharacterized membrane protein
MSMAETVTPGAKPKIPGQIRALLIGSLGLNLLVVGVIAGGLIAGPPHPPRTMVGDIGMGSFTEALSREDRDALRQAAESDGSAFREMRRAARADIDTFVAALQAETWDGRALQSLFDAYRQRNQNRMEIGQRLFADRIAAMTPEARKAYATRLQDSLRRQDDKRAGGGKDMPPPPPPGY